MDARLFICVVEPSLNLLLFFTITELCLYYFDLTLSWCCMSVALHSQWLLTTAVFQLKPLHKGVKLGLSPFRCGWFPLEELEVV